MNEEEPKKEDILEDRSSKKWLELLKQSERDEKTYAAKCDSIDKLYADLESLAGNGKDRDFQIFWANLEVLKPSIYSRAPVPEVSPRFKDRRALPRRAAEIIERALSADFEADDVHGTLICARDDLALNARGVVWMLDGKHEGQYVPILEHVDRKDFRHGAARKWREVPWVARGAWMTRKEVEARFGQVPPTMNFGEIGMKEDDAERRGKARIWEMWHRTENLVLWLSEEVDDVLDVKEPWMDLKGFFPCPRPAYGTLKRATLTPVPDFVYYRDQVEEITAATRRIGSLMEAIRLKGFYEGGNGDVAEALEAAMRSVDDRAILVPVSSMAALGGKGMNDAIMWLPLEQVAATISTLVELRRQLIQDVYEITGLSDIMRGATDPNETLGAQELKSQYGSIRIQERQAEMARLGRDVARLKAEFYAEHADLAQLVELAQVDDLPRQGEIEEYLQQMAVHAQQQGEEAIAAAREEAEKFAEENPTFEAVQSLLRDQRTRPFVLDIETDSTIRPDETADQKRRMDFITAVGGYVAQAAPIVQTAPILAPFAAASLEYLANGFQVPRTMDQAIDELTEQMRGLADQAQQPDPAQQEMQEAAIARERAETALKEAQAAKAEAEAMKAQMEAQAPPEGPEAPDYTMDRERMAVESAEKEADRVAAAETRAAELAHDREAAREKAELDAQAAREQRLHDLQVKALELEAQAKSADGQGEKKDALKPVMDGMSALMEALSAQIEIANAPKRVIRGDDGEVVGVEPAVTLN